jgi:hypothetical protein
MQNRSARDHRAKVRGASGFSPHPCRDPRQARRVRLDEIVAGTLTGIEQIAARDKWSIRQVNMTISLAFLAPDLVKAALIGLGLCAGRQGH